MKTLKNLWIAFGISAFAVQGLIACSSDGDDNNGTAGSSAGGSSGATGNPWKKGKTGNVSNVKIVSQNGGPVLGMDIGMAEKTASKPMNFNPPYKPMDVGDDAGLPPTIPQADFSEATPTDKLVVEVPPYEGGYPPYTVYYYPDGKVEAVNHFPTWHTDFTLDCFNDYPVKVNGLNLQAYSGAIFDVASGNQRQFLVSNGSDCVYELLPGGATSKLVCGLLAPNSILYSQQHLIVATTPGYTKNMPGSLPVAPVELWKVTIGTEPEKTKIAEMPIGADYAKSDSDLGVCHKFPFTDYALPTSIRVPVANATDGGYLVADMGAGKIYKVSSDGTSVTEFKGLEGLQIAAFTQAPNDIVYMVTAPLLGDKNDGSSVVVIKGVTLWALDPQNMTWTELNEFPGYENLANNMSGSNKAVPCPAQFQGAGYVQCLQPDGVNLKIIPGQTLDKAYLMVSDTITFRLFQIIMNLGTGDPDAGSSGSGGSSGEGGAAGEGGSGTGGETGTGGTTGEGGSSGEGGAGGSTGEGGSSGTDGDAAAE